MEVPLKLVEQLDRETRKSIVNMNMGKNMTTKDGKRPPLILIEGGNATPPVPVVGGIKKAIGLIRMSMEMNTLNCECDLPHYVVVRSEIAHKDMEMAVQTLELVLSGINSGGSLNAKK